MRIKLIMCMLVCSVCKITACGQSEGSSGGKYFEAQAEYYKGIFAAAYEHKDSISAFFVIISAGY